MLYGPALRVPNARCAQTDTQTRTHTRTQAHAHTADGPRSSCHGSSSTASGWPKTCRASGSSLTLPARRAAPRGARSGARRLRAQTKTRRLRRARQGPRSSNLGEAALWTFRLQVAVAAGQVIKVRVNLKSKSAARCLRTVLNRRSATWPVCAARGALCTSGWAPCTLADTASAASAGTRREGEDAAAPAAGSGPAHGTAGRSRAPGRLQRAATGLRSGCRWPGRLAGRGLRGCGAAFHQPAGLASPCHVCHIEWGAIKPARPSFQGPAGAMAAATADAGRPPAYQSGNGRPGRPA